MAGASCFLFTILLILPTHATESVNIQNSLRDRRFGLSDSHVSETSRHSLPTIKSKSALIPSLEVSMENECSTWNKANVTADDYHKSYCSSRCLGDTKLDVPAYEDCPGNNLTCFPCSCQRPQCEGYGTCCPDITRQEPSSEPNDFQPKDIIIMCDDYSTLPHTFLYIRSCPKHFPDQHVVSMCLDDDIPPHEQTTESFSRAYDNSTGVVYYNKYCADCNNVSTPILWDVTIRCENYQQVYSATTKEELLRLSLKLDATCQVQQNPPKDLSLFSCEKNWFVEIISSCNVTGEWSAHDHDVYTQCESNPDLQNVMARVTETGCGTYYKNIFCVMCNRNSISGEMRTLSGCKRSDPGPIDLPHHALPFSLLLGSISHHYTLEPTFAGITCSISEWPSPDNQCRSLDCSRGKVLNNATCGTAINIITGLAYKLHVVYILKSLHEAEHHSQCSSHPFLNSSHHFKNSSHLLDDFALHFYKSCFAMFANAEIQITTNSSITGKSQSAGVSIEMLQNDKENVTYDTTVEAADILLEVKAFFVAKTIIPRDQFENDIISMLHSNISHVQTGNISRALTGPMFVPDVPDFVRCFNQLFTQQDQFEDKLVVLFPNNAETNDVLMSYTNRLLTLSPVLTCAHVTFNQSEFKANINCTIFPPTWHISLSLGQVNVTFSDVTDLKRLTMTEESGDDQLKVCVDLLKEKVQELKNRSRLLRFKESAVYLWQYYLSHVCIGLSMICLLVTLLTFSLLPTLRNNAGTNNMSLSGTILLAQASLLSSVHVDGPSSLCTVLGICTHFFWLSVTCWSFICCLHMFRVFTAKTGVTQSSAASRQISLIKKVLASILAPAVVIATVMASSYLTSGGQRIGYTDSNPCYLDSSLVTLLSLVAPLGVVCVVNVGFFVSAIYKIHQVTMLQTHSSITKKERKTFTIYIKLSTMTGSFWVVAIVSEIADNDPLRFVAIILNGFQGVFLFLSLVCNKRVMRTCFRILFSQIQISETSGSSGSELFKEKTSNVSLTP